MLDSNRLQRKLFLFFFFATNARHFVLPRKIVNKGNQCLRDVKMTLSRAFNIVIPLIPRPLSVFHLGQSVSDHVARAKKRSRLRHRNELILRD